MDANTAAWAAWVDERIEGKCSRIIEALEALGESCVVLREDLRAADAKIQALSDEVEIKLRLRRQLDRLKGEVAEARAQAPDFKAELESLRAKTEKQEKLITRLRGEASQLRYAQGQLESKQQKDRQEATLTVTQLSVIGAQTRTALEALRESGIDFIEEWSPSGLAS